VPGMLFAGRQPAPSPTMITVVTEGSNHAQIKENSNRVACNDRLLTAGPRIKPKSNYWPTPGLVALFKRTGCKSHNPNTILSHPPSQTVCTYAEVVCNGMDHRGAPMNNSRPEMDQRGHPTGARRTFGQAGTVTHRGFNGPHRGFGAGFQGVRGGEASMAEDIEVTQGNTVVAPTGSAHCTWVALPRRTTIG
jgi:hypothetical protein